VSDYKTYILCEKELGLWDDFIGNSYNRTLFHRIDWLKAIADHSKMEFIPLAVKKGNKVVCLFPVFFRKIYGLRILESPPGRSGISHLGPLLNIPATNIYNYEMTYIHILDEIIDFAENSIGYDYFRIIHVPGILDMRPFAWRGFSVLPKYTYQFDLREGEEKLYNRFHSVTKNMIKKAENNKYISVSRDLKYILSILSITQARLSNLNIKFRISSEYLNKLLDSSISTNMESIAVIYNEHAIAGNITLTDNTNAYAWIGFVNKEEHIPGIWELIFWENIKEYSRRDYSTYEIVDANIRRLCQHKARYGAQLIHYFDVYKTSVKGEIALKLMNVYKKHEK
jgi:hypothetical protein